jgi:tRNA pseudouridine13 synthase
MNDFADALRLPRAHGGAVGSGLLRSRPEDFVVREWLGFEADGEGEHWLLTVRKRGANTQWVAKRLGQIANVHPRDVGFAGLKDRNAVAEQAFTVPVRSAVPNWLVVSGEGFEVVRAQRHRRKLKRGALKGNDFQVVIRDFTGDRAALATRLAVIEAAGVPNYFGPQRFGREGANLRRAVAHFTGQRVIEDRFERGFALSAARALLFNAVLAARIDAGTWNRFEPGDVANLDGSNSIFVPESIDPGAIDAALLERCAQLDIHPTGPLWGRGEPSTSGSVQQLEKDIASRSAVLAEGLASAGLEQERRALRLRVRALTHSFDGNDVTLRFRLGRGCFATAVLHELLQDAFDMETPESD